MLPVLAIVGPTAVGKSQVALALAERIGGEIISADSRQVYRGMDIGTAKPTSEERARVRHHLIDVVDPDREFAVTHYRSLALSAIEDVLSSAKVPILVGGTGLYIRAITGGLSTPVVPPDSGFRQAMEARSIENGPLALHAELATVDPIAAQRIHPQNVRRVIRALEVWHSTGQPITKLQRLEPPAFRVHKIGLTCAREALYDAIDRRVEQMMRAGLVDEVRCLVAKGYGWELPAMSGLGYRQIGQFLRGEIELEAAVQRIKYSTHRFARQQYTWFRLDAPDIRWFSVTEQQPSEVVDACVQEFLQPASVDF